MAHPKPQKRFLVKRRITYDIDAVVEAPNAKVARQWASYMTSAPVNVLDPDRLFNATLHFGPLMFEEIPENQEVLVTIPIDKDGIVDRERLKKMLRNARKRKCSPAKYESTAP